MRAEGTSEASPRRTKIELILLGVLGVAMCFVLPVLAGWLLYPDPLSWILPVAFLAFAAGEFLLTIYRIWRHMDATGWSGREPILSTLVPGYIQRDDPSGTQAAERRDRFVERSAERDPAATRYRKTLFTGLASTVVAVAAFAPLVWGLVASTHDPAQPWAVRLLALTGACWGTMALVAAVAVWRYQSSEGWPGPWGSWYRWDSWGIPDLHEQLRRQAEERRTARRSA